MVRSALVVATGFLLLLAACALPPAPLVVQGCDPTPLIHELKPGFSPVDYGNCAPDRPCHFKDPTQYIASPPSGNFPNEVAAIVAAYNVAPAFFQNSLCGLQAIYVDTDPHTAPHMKDKPFAWGMRERLFPTGPGRYREHIAISTILLATLAAAQNPYADYEKTVLTNLLSIPATMPPKRAMLRRRVSSWADGITFIAAPDPPAPSPAASRTAISLLGILAHEVGHTVWYDSIINAAAAGVDQPILPASEDFSSISWIVKEHRRGFHNFGVPNIDAQPQRPPVYSSVADDLQHGCISCAAMALDRIYSGEWASLFATVAPDEDFVETYKLMVVTAGPLKSLQIGIPPSNITPGYSRDILYNLDNPQSRLFAKAQWIRGILHLQ